MWIPSNSLPLSLRWIPFRNRIWPCRTKMSVQIQQIHRRKSSKDEEEIRIATTTPTIEVRVQEETSCHRWRSRPPELVPSPHHLGHGRTYWTLFTPRGLDDDDGHWTKPWALTHKEWPSSLPSSNVQLATFSHGPIFVDRISSSISSSRQEHFCTAGHTRPPHIANSRLIVGVIWDKWVVQTREPDSTLMRAGFYSSIISPRKWAMSGSALVWGLRTWLILRNAVFYAF